jgi:hypothetical protein
MTILNSQFDVISHDPHKNALAGLMTVLAVKNAPGPYDSLPASGTPVPGAIPSGTIVVMDTDGKAIVADGAVVTAPAMLFITVDGDQDYDGAFVHKLTCIQGGGEFRLDTNNFVTDTYTPGEFLTCANGTDAGKFRKAVAGEQIYGMVNQDGQDTVNNTLDIIVPQGISPAAV